ncbi:MAG: DUF3990 domain-containing protein [Selenomonadaceae bacterium]|nr:DUF3990 domain-containing protein [Selenomonadaceae bacterium]
MIKTVYHGTTLEFADNIVKNGIDLTIGRKNLDFGQGFYTTADKTQAVTWAKRVAYNARPAVRVFKSSFENLNVKYFPVQNDEWKDVVYQNRILNVDPLMVYDCVVGPMADGKIKRLISDVSLNRITKDMFLEIISKGIGSQIVYKTVISLQCLAYQEIWEV